MTPEQYYAYPSVTRYFDHLQSLASNQGTSKENLGLELDFPIIPLNFENAPRVTRVVDAPKPKKEKAAIAAAITTEKPVEEKKGDKKEKGAKKDAAAPTSGAAPVEGGSKKKEKAPKAAAPAPAPAADAGEPVPSMIDLRVGKIVQGWICLLDQAGYVPDGLC